VTAWGCPLFVEFETKQPEDYLWRSVEHTSVRRTLLSAAFDVSLQLPGSIQQAGFDPGLQTAAPNF
jgi:hypothetical protein